MPRISVIIINWNTTELLRRCLEALRRDPRVGEWQVIVMDNGSDEDPSAVALEAFPSVEMVRSPRNLGFAAGNNLAAGQARGEYLLFLNADTETDAGVVGALAEYLDAHPEVGIAGPRLIGLDGRPQASSGTFPGACQYIRSALRLGRPVPEATGPVDYVAGAALMIRRNAFDEVGGWPEVYFFYGEDAELADCLRRTASLETHYLHGPTVMHVGGGSVAGIPKWKALAGHRGALLFVSRNRSARALAALRAAIVAVNGARLGACVAALPVVACIGKAASIVRRIGTYSAVIALALAGRSAFSKTSEPRAGSSVTNG